MSYGLRLSLIFTVVCWLVALGALVAWVCGEPAALNLVAGVAPAGLVGAVASLIEWRSEREHRDPEPSDGRDVHRVG